jgi:hypothetical protein
VDIGMSEAARKKRKLDAAIDTLQESSSSDALLAEFIKSEQDYKKALLDSQQRDRQADRDFKLALLEILKSFKKD